MTAPIQTGALGGGRNTNGVGPKGRAERGMEVCSCREGHWGYRVEVPGGPLSHSNTRSVRSLIPFPTRATLRSPFFLFSSTMGRKLDPTKKKRGPGRKARKQKGAETELARFLPAGKG